MRKVALVGSLLISLLLLIIPLMFVFGPSGTTDENIEHLPRTIAEAPLFFALALVHLAAPIGIFAALCGWRFGRPWTMSFALLYGVETAFLNWGYWHEKQARPGFNGLGWFMLFPVLWALFTIFTLAFATPEKSSEPSATSQPRFVRLTRRAGIFGFLTITIVLLAVGLWFFVSRPPVVTIDEAFDRTHRLIDQAGGSEQVRKEATALFRRFAGTEPKILREGDLNDFPAIKALGKVDGIWPVTDNSFIKVRVGSYLYGFEIHIFAKWLHPGVDVSLHERFVVDCVYIYDPP